MKKYLLLLLLAYFSLEAQIVNIPDANFKAKLLAATTTNFIASTGSPYYSEFYNNWSPASSQVVDTNGDGEIQVAEAQAIKSLDLKYSNISNLTGIEYFTNLKTVKLKFNSIDTFNASTLINLEYLDLYLNGLQSLTLGEGLTQLSYLDCSSNQLTALDVTGCTGLVTLKCGTNNINGLVISDLPNLVTLA